MFGNNGRALPAAYQNYASFARSFPDGTSSTVLFAEKYTTARGSYNGQDAFENGWNNLIPAFAVTVAPLHNYSQEPVPAPPPAMFQVRPNPYQKRCDGRLASTPHPAMNVCLADGGVRALSSGTDPALVWWPMLTPGGGEAVP